MFSNSFRCLNIHDGWQEQLQFCDPFLGIISTGKDFDFMKSVGPNIHLSHSPDICSCFLQNCRVCSPFEAWVSNPRPSRFYYEARGHICRYVYRVIQEESAILWEMIVCVILSKKVHMNMGPILNGYRDMVKRRYGPSCEHEQQLRNK